jgi:hypothetical protein
LAEKPDPDSIFRRKGSEITLVRGGKKHAYLWVGYHNDSPEQGDIYTFRGASSLRKLAYAILKEVGE